MIIPTVHLNGTSREALLSQVTEAGFAIATAIQALDAASPNGRDYYPQGPAALKEAEAEHRSRGERLRSVLRELEKLTEGIAEAS